MIAHDSDFYFHTKYSNYTKPAGWGWLVMGSDKLDPVSSGQAWAKSGMAQLADPLQDRIGKPISEVL